MTPTYALDAPLARDPVIVVTVFGFLATFTTGLRLYALKLRQVRIGAPEILILVALVSWGRSGSQWHFESGTDTAS